MTLKLIDTETLDKKINQLKNYSGSLDDLQADMEIERANNRIIRILEELKSQLQDLEPLVTDAWNDGHEKGYLEVDIKKHRDKFLKSKKLIP